jgi:hypothetical protein
MGLLFDQGTPVPLRNHLPRHTVEIAYERGWHDLKNGELLALVDEACVELQLRDVEAERR